MSSPPPNTLRRKRSFGEMFGLKVKLTAPSVRRKSDTSLVNNTAVKGK